MRLIDADAFKQVFCADCIAATCENCRINYYFEHSAPIVDLTKHGEWVNDKGIYRCTACNTLCAVAGWASRIPEKQMYEVFKFCPECGAKMDEAKKDETN